MSAPNEPTGILAWILGGIAIGAALWAIGAKVFSFVTRNELSRRFEAQDTKFLKALEQQEKQFKEEMAKNRADRVSMHADNKENFREVRDDVKDVAKRLGDVETGQARIEGRIGRLNPTGGEG